MDQLPNMKQYISAHKKENYTGVWSEEKFLCPNCKSCGMRKNLMMVLTTYPVKHMYHCDNCGHIEYLFFLREKKDMAKLEIPIKISLAEVTIDVLQNIECANDTSKQYKNGFCDCKNMMIDALRKVTINDDSVVETQQMLSFMHMMRNAKSHEECNVVYNAMDKLMWQMYDKKIMELHVDEGVKTHNDI